MILEDCLVVVEQRQIGSRVDVERVGGSAVLVVVNRGGVNGGEDLDVRQPLDHARVGQQLMRRLRHVRAVQHVVIRVAMTTIPCLDSTQELLQDRRIDLVLVLKTVSLKQFEYDETQCLREWRGDCEW